MALRGLTIEEMVAISGAWITPGAPERSAIEGVPLIAALLPYLEAAHAGVLAAAPKLEDPSARRISEEQAVLDGRHDGLVRGIHSVLTALAGVSERPDQFLRLRDLLLPEGPVHAQRTYSGEAGHAERVEARLDAETRAELAQISIHEQKLIQLVENWLSTSKQLGALEQERGKPAGQLVPGAPQIHAARLRWIRATNALLANSELAEIDEATNGLLFTRLRNVEAAADRRTGRRSDDEPAVPAPEPGASG